MCVPYLVQKSKIPHAATDDIREISISIVRYHSGICSQIDANTCITGAWFTTTILYNEFRMQYEVIKSQ